MNLIRNLFKKPSRERKIKLNEDKDFSLDTAYCQYKGCTNYASNDEVADLEIGSCSTILVRLCTTHFKQLNNELRSFVAERIDLTLDSIHEVK